jgi:hypothetical protein
LFFTQLNNRIGHYLIVVEKMTSSVSSFIVLAGFYFLSFSLGFQFITSSENLCPLIPSNSTDAVFQKRIPFDGFFNSLYETFLLGIGVAAPKDWYFTHSHYSGALIILYILSLVFNTVILLNLMIAIMNQRMVELVDQKKSLVGIAQLAINIFAEDRLIYSQQTFGRSAQAKEKYLVKKDGKSFLCTAEPCC